ncbi:RHS repeat-associated core domain-containing protein [Solitalea canadensis]|uniref:RHS repeat-associated core domain protein n=1 Tax=Solitalea canadensis (strain ATCC 29591 / DSM 3403 / JCM 21819 / LMG 8368 / NBRC 15130 / NCIMB 12057 / USAM 9D) TaxID=929556 RepID=H8KV71_SOLCM|nr:RHS repeat-associated core domain-containing protein [Solitalea canadensis]AFD06129.1 RHS repeat-associated core domain protein [Solitalea canadensis DSM 3403]
MEQPIYGADRLGTFFAQGSVRRYELKDHLGNVRGLLLRSKNGINADIYSFKDYYAFGSKAQSGGTDDYRYDYQGQYAEKDKETDWNAFDLRMYDAKIGRWLSVDPKAQYWSPYVGMGNNPISGVDPDGAFKYWFGAFVNWVAGGFEGRIEKSNEARKGEWYIGIDYPIDDNGNYGVRTVRTFDWNLPKVTIPNKYGGLNDYRAYQAYPFYIPGETRFDRSCRLFAAAHREEMLDFGGGGYNMFGGYGKGTQIAEELVVASGAGGETLPMVVERMIMKGEKIADIINEAKGLTWTTGNEYALVTLQNGERALVSGGPGGISFKTNQIIRLFGHTHPTSAGPSSADFVAVKLLNQSKQYVFHGGNITRIP